jgi:hypothetical protein
LGNGEPNAISNAIGYATFFSGSHDAVIRVYDESGNVIETYEHEGEFQRVVDFTFVRRYSIPMAGHGGSLRDDS